MIQKGENKETHNLVMFWQKIRKSERCSSGRMRGTEGDDDVVVVVVSLTSCTRHMLCAAVGSVGYFLGKMWQDVYKMSVEKHCNDGGDR